MSLVRCPQCQREVEKHSGAVNRAAKIGAPIYCGRACAGLARRIYRAKAQKVAEKKLYDAEYRRKNRQRLKAEKAAHYQRTRDPVKEAIYRKAHMARHVAYCQSPEYKQWKQAYDSAYRAEKLYGPFAESFLLLQAIEKEIASRMSRYDIYMANGTLNKWLHRRREYERLIRG